MTVTPEDRDAMARLLEIMGGKAPDPPFPKQRINRLNLPDPDRLPGETLMRWHRYWESLTP